MRIGILIAAAISTALSACVSPIARDGGTPLDQSALRSPAFVMAEAKPGGPDLAEAREAVARALVGHGLRQDPDAPYRVDVGLAVAPLPLRISEGDAPRGAPTPAGVTLCRRKQYVLSVAMIDRNDGRVVFRNSATAHRCAKAAAKTIPQLARQALGR